MSETGPSTADEDTSLPNYIWPHAANENSGSCRARESAADSPGFNTTFGEPDRRGGDSIFSESSRQLISMLRIYHEHQKSPSASPGHLTSGSTVHKAEFKNFFNP